MAYRGAAFVRFAGLSSAAEPSEGLFAAEVAVAAALRLNGIARGSERVTTESRECPWRLIKIG